MPQLWIVAGPNGAGKTTLVSSRLAKRITVINPDVIAQELPRSGDRLDEWRAGAIAIAHRNDLLARGADFAIETTLAGSSALRLIRAAKSGGYKVTLVYVGLANADLSVQRVLDRVRLGGHAVQVSALERRYSDTMSKLAPAIRLADRSYIFDNSSRRRRLLLVYDAHAIRYVVSDMPDCTISSLAGILE